jgi:hypothetical protein
MPLTFTTAPTPPKSPPPSDSVDIIVGGKPVGQLSTTTICESATYHAHFTVPGIGFCGMAETVGGFGKTPEDAIRDAMTRGLARFDAARDAFTKIGRDIGVLS